jgi:hypothetical protein
MEIKRTKQKHVVSIRFLCVCVRALCVCKSWFVRFVCAYMSVGVPEECGTQAEFRIQAQKHAQAHKQAPLTHETHARVCQYAFVMCVCVVCARVRAGLFDFVCVYVSWCAGRLRHTIGNLHTCAQTRTSTQTSTINAPNASTCVSIRVCCVRVRALCACESWFVRFVCVRQLVCR